MVTAGNHHNSPLVTIGIPTFNSQCYLRECLQSIARQTYKNIEVVISDNASIDDTLSIIQEFSTEHGWQYHANNVNVGALQNFNKLVDLASGKYLAIYHADDVYAPDIIEQSVRVLESDQSIALVGTLCTEIDSEGAGDKHYGLPLSIAGMDKSVYSFEEAFVGVLEYDARRIFFVTPSIMVRKDVYDKLGHFAVDGKYKSAADYEMWLRVAKHYPVAIIDKCLMKYRIHECQGSELETRKNIEILDIVSVIEDYMGSLSSAEVKTQARRFIEKSILITGIRQNCLGLYQKSLVTTNRIKYNYRVWRKVLIACNERHVSLRWIIGLLKNVLLFKRQCLK